MCELLAVTGKDRIVINSFLTEFFRHSEVHSHGWGLSIFYGNAASLEKEPVKALESNYLHSRLNNDIRVTNAIAHIRLASVGALAYENCHPFIKHDNRGRGWTLAHNGTIFNPAAVGTVNHGSSLDEYKSCQEGSTDSERILFWLIDNVNKTQTELGCPLSAAERFALIGRLVTALSNGNKLNLLIWDCDYLYVHTNYADTLYQKRLPESGSMIFATAPLGQPQGWQPVPFLRLQVWHQGMLVYDGAPDSTEYIDKQKGWEYANIDYSVL